MKDNVNRTIWAIHKLEDVHQIHNYKISKHWNDLYMYTRSLHWVTFSNLLFCSGNIRWVLVKEFPWVISCGCPGFCFTVFRKILVSRSLLTLNPCQETGMELGLTPTTGEHNKYRVRWGLSMVETMSSQLNVFSWKQCCTCTNRNIHKLSLTSCCLIWTAIMVPKF